MIGNRNKMEADYGFACGDYVKIIEYCDIRKLLNKELPGYLKTEETHDVNPIRSTFFTYPG